MNEDIFNKIQICSRTII